jgi:hypothetical protein
LSGHGALHDPVSYHPYQPGQAWFLPASLEVAHLQPKEATSLLRVTVPDTNLLVHQLQNQGFEMEAISRVVLETT